MSKEFGSYLKKIRKDRGLTAKVVGEKLGVSQSYISQLENGLKGVPSPEMISRISSALNYDYVELMIHAGYIQSELIYTLEQTLIGRLYREVKAYEGEEYLSKLQREYILRTNELPFGSEIEVVYTFFAKVGTPGDVLELVRLNVHYDINTAASAFGITEEEYVSLERTEIKEIQKISNFNDVIKENFGIVDFELAYEVMINEVQEVVAQINTLSKQSNLIDVNIKQFENVEESNDLAHVLIGKNTVTIEDRVLNPEERSKALQILKIIFS